MGMGKPRDDLRFSLESSGGFSRKRRMQDLDRDLRAPVCMFSQVDLCETAAPKQTHKPVAAPVLINQRIQHTFSSATLHHTVLLNYIIAQMRQQASTTGTSCSIYKK